VVSMSRFHPYGQEPGTPGMTFAGFRAFATPGLARPLPPGPPPGARPLPPGPPPVARPLPRGAPPGMLSYRQSPAGLADRMGGAQHGVSAAVLGVDGARRAVMEQPSECLQYLVPGSSRPVGLRGPHGPLRTNSQQTNSAGPPQMGGLGDLRRLVHSGGSVPVTWGVGIGAVGQDSALRIGERIVLL